MNRREFIGASAAIIAASRLSPYETLASQIGANKRVGIIGPGWYGKSDLLRLVQGRQSTWCRCATSTAAC